MQVSHSKSQYILNNRLSAKGNIEIKFDHVNNQILVLKNNQSIMKFYNTKKDESVFLELNAIIHILQRITC